MFSASLTHTLKKNQIVFSYNELIKLKLENLYISSTENEKSKFSDISNSMDGVFPSIYHQLSI